MKFLRALAVLLFIVSPALADGPVWGIATTSTPGAVQPDGSTVTITPQGVISSTASGGGGISVQGGGGNRNVFTNAMIFATGVPGIYWTLGTNDAAIVGGGTPLLEYPFSSQGPSGLAWTDGAGNLYLALTVNPSHDGPASAANMEFAIESANNIAFIANGTSQIGNGAHYQMGGRGIAQYFYFNSVSNLNQTLVEPSMMVYWPTRSLTNGGVREGDPGFVSAWPKSNVWEWEHDWFIDSGTYGNANKNTPWNGAEQSIRTYAGTNGSGIHYSGVQIFGRNGTTTNQLRVDTNGITTFGVVTMGADGNTIFMGQSDQLQVTAGANGDVRLWGAGGAGDLIVGDGVISPTHDLLFCGAGLSGGPGTAIINHGLVINGATATTNNDDLELRGSGKIWAPSNTAPMIIFSNLTPVFNGFITNLEPCRVACSFGVICTATGQNGQGTVTFTLHEQAGTIPMQYGSGTGATATTNVVYANANFNMSPNDYVQIATNCVNTGSQVIASGSGIWYFQNE